MIGIWALCWLGALVFRACRRFFYRIDLLRSDVDQLQRDILPDYGVNSSGYPVPRRYPKRKRRASP